MRLAAAAVLLLLACRPEQLVTVDPFDAGPSPDPPMFTVPLPEVCNKIDDDFDGVVDNNLPVTFCYTGPVGSLSFGECRPGSMRCINGKNTCYGELGPSAEVCDLKDNDCDGEIDEGYEPRIDIAVIVDNSGSMGSYIASIRDAITGIMRAYQQWPSVKWAIIGAPGTHTAAETYPYPRLDFDMGTTGEAINVMGRQDGQSGSGIEPTTDAISLVDTGTMPIHWTGNPRLIVVFADEPPQSILNLPAKKTFNKSIIFTNRQQADYSAFGDQYDFSTSEAMAEIITKEIKSRSCP